MKSLVLISIFMTVLNQATAQTDVGSAEFIRTLNQVSNFFENERAPAVNCAPPTAAEARAATTCTLDPLCRQVEQNQNSSYLFKTPTGGIPNFIMRDAITDGVTQCLNNQRELLLSQVETRLGQSLAAANAETRSAYQNILNGEYNSLIDGQSSPLFAAIGNDADTTAVATELRRRYPNLTDANVVSDLAEAVSTRHAGARQMQWQQLLGEGTTPPNRAAVGQTVQNVMTSMQGWLAGRGREFAGPGVPSVFSGMRITVETEFGNPQSQCDPDDVAFYNNMANAMVICPRGASLPAGALFTVVAHELGHAISSCNPDAANTPANQSSWDRVNQCLVNPATGPAPAQVNWDQARAAAAALTNPGMQQAALRVISEDQSQGQTYACFQNMTAYRMGPLHWHPPLDQTEETQADWISTQILQQQADTMSPEAARNFALEALSPSILKRACNLSGNAFVPRVQAALAAAGCTGDVNFRAPTSMQRDEGGDEHMAPAKRFGVHLQTPVIHQMMGCPGQPQGCR